ncbi:MAG: PAS domain-containing protein [Chloroflexi bacterium]|nr:PAS domain-containing protein [Chloroflexota bacterium]
MLIAKGPLNRASTPLVLWPLGLASVTILARLQTPPGSLAAACWGCVYLLPTCIAACSFSLGAGLATATLGILSLAPAIYSLMSSHQVSSSSPILLASVALCYASAVVISETSTVIRKPPSPERVQGRLDGLVRWIPPIKRSPRGGNTERMLARRLEQLSRLHEVAKRLNAARSLEEVCKVVLASAMETTGATSGAIIRLGREPSRASAALAVCDGASWRLKGESRLPGVWESLVDKVVQMRQPVLYINPNGAAAGKQAPSPFSGPVQMAVPIFHPSSASAGGTSNSEADVIAILYLDLAWGKDPAEGDADDRAFLVLLAEQAAAAIERASLYDAATSERQRTERVLSSLTAGVCTTDRDGRILSLNPAAERMLGWSSEEALGKLCCDVLRRGAPRKPDCPLLRAMSTGSTLQCWPLDCELAACPSEGIPISRSIAPLLGGDGEILGTVSLLRDVSEEEKVIQQKNGVRQAGLPRDTLAAD